MSDAAALMDRMYRRQRHIYDASRKFYLLGRDCAIAGLNPRPGDAVLEIGCGTGRNLAKIAAAWPQVSLYGCDVSQQMLSTASAALRRQGLSGRVRLAQGDATQLDSMALFGRAQFDRVVISYALSMIPPWRAVIASALDLVAPGGALTIVDFGDGGELPAWFGALLRHWLASFSVTPRVELAAELQRLAQERGFAFTCATPFRRYAILATLARAPQAP